MDSIRIMGLFIIAGLAEISGVYLVWQWVRTGKPAFWGVLGLIALFVYSLIQTAQAINFGRAFAAYGGVFIVLALLWGWRIDGHTPDRWDWLGAGVSLVGVALILWGPRS